MSEEVSLLMRGNNKSDFEDSVQNTTSSQTTSTSNDVWKSAINALPNSYLIVSDKLEIIEANEQALSLFDVSRKNILRKSLFDLFNKYHTPLSVNEILNCKYSKKTEHQLIYLAIKSIWLNLEITPVFRNDTDISHYIIVLKNTTQKELSHTQLENVRDYNLSAFYKSSISMSIASLQGNYLRINKAFSDYLGYTPEELIGTLVTSVSHQEDAEKEQTLINELIEGKRNSYILNKRYIHSSGKIIWGRLHRSIIYENGEAQYLFGVWMNIDAEKKTREILDKSETRYRVLAESAQIGFFETDQEGKCVYVNRKWRELTGLSMEQAQLDGWRSSIHPDDRETIESLWNTNIKKQESWNAEFRFRTPSGRTTWVISSASPIFNKEGELISYIGTNLDITDRKNNEKKLHLAKEKAEESDRLKSAFLANMSHEIRTPMNGILGFSELLKDQNLPQDQKEEFLNIIEESGKRMVSLIDNLIDISKIESGQMPINKVKFKLKEPLLHLHAFFKLETAKKGLSLECCPRILEDEQLIETDKDKFYAILFNLINNAIKYTNVGCIEIGYLKKNSKMEFYVKDSGIGIAPSKFNVIFKHFAQADHTMSRPYEGAGLGLSITEAYVKMLGGEIWLESEHQKGSTFYFTIPIGDKHGNLPPKKEDLKSTDNKHFSNLTILVVDDDSTSMKLLNHILRGNSNSILNAHTGYEAIEICKNQQVDLIFMDIKMPGIDGLETTQKIRQFDTKVKIIAQTAFALSDDEEKTLAAGCDYYISKPILRQRLMQLLGEIFGVQ